MTLTQTLLADEPPGEVIDRATVRIKRLLPGPIERVWAYLTEADKRALWFAGGEMAQRPGAEFGLEFHHSQLSHEPSPEWACSMEGHVNHCRITGCEPPALLSFTWPEADGEDSEVTFELTPQDGEVLLTVTHRRLYNRDTMVGVASGWHAHLGLLADQLHGRTPRGFWTAHADAKELYEPRIPAN